MLNFTCLELQELSQPKATKTSSKCLSVPPYFCFSLVENDKK